MKTIDGMISCGEWQGSFGERNLNKPSKSKISDDVRFKEKITIGGVTTEIDLRDLPGGQDMSNIKTIKV